MRRMKWLEGATSHTSERVHSSTGKGATLRSSPLAGWDNVGIKVGIPRAQPRRLNLLKSDRDPPDLLEMVKTTI